MLELNLGFGSLRTMRALLKYLETPSWGQGLISYSTNGRPYLYLCHQLRLLLM